MNPEKLIKKNARGVAGAIVVLSVALVGGVYAYVDVRSEREELVKQLSKTRADLTSATIENEGLTERLEDEEERVVSLADELQKLTGTVNILEKLRDTDEELLQKYSKVYFLNEHYTPQRLKTIPDSYVAKEGEEERIHASVWPYLEKLLEEAEDDDSALTIVSAYRSFDEQTELKAGYRVVYGFGANQFSADQGYSEHQLGTTVDFSTPEMGGALGGFENSEAYEWLRDHAHEFGFTLSYPPGNSYYVFEPWHWRYVGTKLAVDLHNDDKYFYDLDQRAIDEYLVDLFE